MSVDIVTFGCRLNTYESEAIRLRAGEAQLQGAVIFNTCAVTAEAMRQSRQAIRKARRARPEARIIVTGCGAQIEPERYAAMPEVDFVLGNREKLRAESYAGLGLETCEKIRVNDIMSVAETAPQMVEHFDGHTRAFLQVQNGCDHRCTFCIIPFARGPARSVPMGAVVAQARTLVEKGYAEIVLTGVDLTSYGADLPAGPGLGALVRKILALVPDLKRLRLSSIDSIEADPALMRAIAEEERLMPHFHLSVQSGDDMILTRMKRRHRRADTIAFCEKVRRVRAEAAFGADIIAGFPTENEAMFENSLKLIDDAGLSQLHVFAFSPRAGTPAARMPQLPPGIAATRATALRAKGAAALAARFQSLIGTRQHLLAERGGLSRTACFAPVRCADALAPGTIADAIITGAAGKHLCARRTA